jgi:hypothetical protein
MARQKRSDRAKAEETAPRVCFVIGPIGEPDSETRRRSDQVYKYIIAPVVEPRGYKLLRADKIGSPGVITSQVIEHVVNASLVVADLSEKNANAFYELAVRHAFRKPIVQVISVEWDLPFDVAAMRTVFFDLTDPDRIEEAKKELAEHLDAIEQDDAVTETPISAALDLQELRSSGDVLAKAVAEIQATLSVVLTELRTRLPTPSAENLVSLLSASASPANYPITGRALGGTSESTFEERFAAWQRALERMQRESRPTDDDGPEAIEGEEE